MAAVVADDAKATVADLQDAPRVSGFGLLFAPPGLGCGTALADTISPAVANTSPTETTSLASPLTETTSKAKADAVEELVAAATEAMPHESSVDASQKTPQDATADAQVALAGVWSSKGETYTIWFNGDGEDGNTGTCLRRGAQGFPRKFTLWCDDSVVWWGLEGKFYCDLKELQKHPGEARWYGAGSNVQQRRAKWVWIKVAEASSGVDKDARSAPSSTVANKGRRPARIAPAAGGTRRGKSWVPAGMVGGA
jgi:hypothetical protein